MQTKSTAEACTDVMEGDKRTYDFTTLLLLSLKRRLYDKLRHNCFRLTHRPNKEWSPEKHIYANEDGIERLDISTESSFSERTNSRPELFYTGDGRWLSSDWTTVGACSTPKKKNSITIERRRRVSVQHPESLENEHKQVTKLGDFMVIQTALPWFFQWIFAMVTLLLLSKTKIQDSKRRQRRNKSQVDPLFNGGFNRRSPVHQKSNGVLSIMPTKRSEPALALVSKSEKNYRKMKCSPRQGSISKKTTVNSNSPRNRHSLAYISPQQRPITTPPPSPRKSVDRVHLSSSSEESRSLQSFFKDSSHCDSPFIDNEVELQHSPPDAVLSTSNTTHPSTESAFTEDNSLRQPEGLLSLHFSRESKIDVRCRKTAEDASMTSSENDECQDESFNDIQKAHSASVTATTGEATSQLQSKRTLQRSARSLPTTSNKSRALQRIRAKKAEARRLAKASQSQDSADFGEDANSPPGLSPAENGIAIPETNPTWKFLSMDSTENGNEDGSRESVVSDRSRHIESQPSVDSSSSVGFELEGAMSLQMSNLIRRNTTQLLRAAHGSGDSSLYRWATISERDSLVTQESSLGIDNEVASQNEGDSSDSDESIEDGQLVAAVKTVDAAPTTLTESRVSPFSAEVYQKRPMPKKQKSSRKKREKEASVDEDSFEAKIVESTKSAQTTTRQTKKPPPPPPSSKSMPNAPVKNQTTKKPAPPPKGKGPAPPPPPPMSRGKGGRGGSGISRAPEVIAMFQAVSKASKDKPKTKHKRRSSKNESSESKSKLESEGSGGDALMQEFVKSSRHFAQIQDDVKNYGPKIEQIIQDLAKTRFETMEQMNAYVYEVDILLEKFADETAVLKQFNWPSKYYVYREALALWLEIKKRNEKCRNWAQGTRGMSAELTKMKKCMELNIKRLDEIQRTLESEVKKFKTNGIPWDTTIIPKLHEGTMILLQKYMQIVYDEVSRTYKKQSHRDNNVQYLTDTIKLAFKIHQFAGGFTGSCTSLFEKIAEFTRTLNTDL